MKRCSLVIRTGIVGLGLLGAAICYGQARPNIVLIMADDLGYGDTGFNGNQIIQTPHLDALAARGMTLSHFYAGNSVCSPTRGTVLTGRHHDRYGVFTANAGHLPAQEITLPKMLKTQGYTTGHFGKWHLGTLSRTLSSKGPKRKPDLNYSPPWERGYDRSFVTESAVTTWNPGIGPRAVDNPFYDDGVALDGEDPSLRGGAARVVMDRAVPFIENATAAATPFLAVVWFHAPHENIEAGPEYLARYKGHGDAAHFYGCITEMDEQVGRLVQTLEQTGAAKNTLIFFCSDNGPEGKIAAGRRAGTTDGLRGRKRDLYDGGVRVPAFAVWPGKISPGSRSGTILSTLDYFPTIQGILKFDLPDDRPIDGEDILPILTQRKTSRERGIPFRYAGKTSALIKDGYKLVMPARELFHLSTDRAEARDLASDKPARAAAMERELEAFFRSAERSHAGGDYTDSTYQPTNPWRRFN
ncbi:MAG: sulfatase-like hydrolase/transferase [Synoicihabitans sp.]